MFSTQSNNSTFMQISGYLIVVVLLGLFIFFGGSIINQFDNLTQKSAITIESLNQTANVFINDEQVGTTPYEKLDIKPGDNKITLKTDSQIYETVINFLPQDENGIYNVLIKRDLGVSNIFSSGQEFWYEKDTSNLLKINSEPKGAEVYIDDTQVGTTPYFADNLTKGEYKVRVHINGYETQEFRVNVDNTYSINVNIKLFPRPVPLNISKFEDSNNLYKIYSNSEQILSNTQMWVNSIVYFNETRGINIDNMGNNKELIFDYFIDFKGNLFNSRGELTTKDNINKVSKGAYLGNSNQGQGLSKEARETYLSLTGGQVLQTKSATVLETGTGWLRVRSGPSVDSSEIQKINVGDTFSVLDEQNGWSKLQIDQSTTGWALKDYLDIEESSL